MNKKKWLVLGNPSSTWSDGATLSVYHFNSREAAEEFSKNQTAANKANQGIFEMIAVSKLKDNPTIIEEVK